MTTQQVFYRKHAGWRRLTRTAGVVAGQLRRGQTNFLGSLFNLERFRPEYLLADHQRPIDYRIPLPEGEPIRHRSSLYVLTPRGRKGRAIDTATERFVEETRMNVSP